MDTRTRSTKKPKPPKEIENVSSLLDRLCSLVECTTVPEERVEKVTVRAIVDTIGRRAYGPLLLAVGLFAISPLTAVPGMTWATAALTLVFSLQLMLGLKRPLLPNALLNASVSAGALVAGVDALRPWARRIDAVIRPRFQFLARPPFVIGVGALCSAAAIVTFPLGFVPLAPLIPGLAVVLFGLGLTARDGLLLTLGGVAVVGAGAALLRFFG